MSIEHLKTDLGFRYIYKINDTNYCFFEVNNRLISIKLYGYVPFDDLVECLRKVTQQIVEENKVPQINVFYSKSKKYSLILNMLRKCGYKCIKSTGVHFSVWTYAQKSLW